MRLEEVKRWQNKDVVLTIRITKQTMEFIKRHNISPARLFNKAIEELQKEVYEEAKQKKIAEDGLKKLATPKRR